MHDVRRLLSGALGFSPIGWLRDTRRMHRLVADFVRSAAPEATATRFAVVVMPWLGTAVPWFSLVCGLFLHAAGSRVTFIVDDLPFGPRPGRFAFVVACIRSVTRRLRRSHEVVALSSCASPTPLPRAALDELGRLAELNAVWALRGEMSAAGRSRYVERSVRQLAPMVAAVAHALEGRRFDAVFVPGGVYGASGVWATQARSLGIRVASFDSGGYGTLMVAADGVACQLQDIPRAFAMLKARPGFAREHAGIIAAARAEIDRRRSGTDKFTSQIPGSRTATEARFEGAVLIALNSSWDSAALGLHAVFDSSTAWIVETVRYLLQATTAPVVVRQHPAERLEIARTSDDYRALLRREFGDEPRLCFIAADEAVNSYDLLAQACCRRLHLDPRHRGGGAWQGRGHGLAFVLLRPRLRLQSGRPAAV